MRHGLRRLLFAALSTVISAIGSLTAAEAANCRKDAIASLRSLSPDGYGIYERVADKSFFLQWITCDDIQLGLSTAVHESVHYITAHQDAFPLLAGGNLQRPHETSTFFAPSRIAGQFGSSDFVSIYLKPGQSSSSTDFTFLLDELNAYTHDLNAAMDLNSLRPTEDRVSHRDGLAATMAFVARYVETAEEREPATWQGLQKPEVTEVISEIWTRAERVMTASCSIPDFGTEDKGFIRRICKPGARSAMEVILGRAPVCPSRCLDTAVSLDEGAQ